jgi:hypothetical protein
MPDESPPRKDSVPDATGLAFNRSFPYMSAAFTRALSKSTSVQTPFTALYGLTRFSCSHSDPDAGLRHRDHGADDRDLGPQPHDRGQERLRELVIRAKSLLVAQAC